MDLDLNNASDLVNGMKEYFDTHDVRKSDIFTHDTAVLTKDPDPRLKALVDKDKYGEYIGRCARNWISSDGAGGVTFYLRPDGRPAGVWKSIGMMGDIYEIFDYHDGYFTGAMFSIIGTMESKANFVYYVTDEGGRVTEMITVYGGMTIINSKKINITRIGLEYDGDKTILKSDITYVYQKSAEGYELIGQEDNNDIGDRVIDDQSGLCEELRSRIKDGMTLEEIVKSFFEVIKNAPENPEEDVEYVAGSNPYFNPFREDNCTLKLVRSTPTEGDEYYMLEMTVRFETEPDDIPFDNKVNGSGNDSLLRSILRSGSYKALKSLQIKAVDIEVYET
ncbi:MAG: hypothetical protein IKH76_03300 [Clostridiales bacterium]|nr:hypothetical protein [Clostridiales bacterium]